MLGDFDEYGDEDEYLMCKISPGEEKMLERIK
jgi:hypothetical protein